MSSVFFYEPFYDFERFLDDALSPRARPTPQQVEGGGSGAVRSLKPRMDLHENTNDNLVTATFELPGLKKEDVQIDVHDGRLTVSAETKISSEHEEKGYAVRERRYGKISRTLVLPQGVKETDIKATMQDGVLNVTFPKSTPEQAPKRIVIS